MISSHHFRPVEMTAQLRESVRDRSRPRRYVKGRPPLQNSLQYEGNLSPVDNNKPDRLLSLVNFTDLFIFVSPYPYT
ncbi:hypothetical protein BV898_16536 [Hypsibius exemplaris]|uniref:Uncharacterized protein n=1 Tax=Hypsibius exemplaris TaxID=2072580 RepID=A0A9X6NG18_HYPEX|nr:hypothetical protein BV898_16536 [Hypsibius exemplaris]